ncbi:hypothetical protein MKK63_04795 [Methylobacterium sp. J-088]|uniref:hypothetical protein n=1 Tax=unclassified Methylobacterium TaxID=2615210 RepID=UPI001FB9503C|nr:MULTISPECIES: hypothetical protein [unclassified Methylobacterium]MCJ2062020.1 hypothetical protein [Methylobacterium sp. J-088]
MRTAETGGGIHDNAALAAFAGRRSEAPDFACVFVVAGVATQAGTPGRLGLIHPGWVCVGLGRRRATLDVETSARGIIDPT